jgi:RNA polymerase sigma-70 factor (ECF subfamily)
LAAIVAQLADAFLGIHNRASSGVLTPADIDALDQILTALCARGRAAHPELPVDDVLFAAHLASCGAPVDTPGAEVHAEDLFLCCAALLGHEAAVRTLREIHRPVLAGYLRRVDASPAFVDEVEQRLWDGALVGSGGAPPKLGSYAGKGPLADWLGVVAQRTALTMRRVEATVGRRVEGAVEARLVAGDPELAFIKGHLRGAFQRAINQALQTLDDRERVVYRMHIVDGVSLDRIGKSYGVSESTVSDWMANARIRIIEEAQRLLREELHASPDEYESMFRLLVSQLDLSVSHLLRQSS